MMVIGPVAKSCGNNFTIPGWGEEQAPWPHAALSSPAQAAGALLLLEGHEGEMKASSSKMSSEMLGNTLRHQSLHDLPDHWDSRQLVTDQRQPVTPGAQQPWSEQVCCSTSDTSLSITAPSKGLPSGSLRTRRHHSLSHQPGTRHFQNV